MAHLRNGCDERIWQKTVVENNYDLIPDLSGMTVIDVGAHVGAFTVACLRRKVDRIVAIEPDSESADLACENIEEAGGFASGTTQLHRMAAWTESENHFTITRHKLNNTGSTSIIYEGDNYPPQDVHSVSLDEVIEQEGGVDILKLDCEGSEYPLLYGSERLADVENIVCEYHETGRRRFPKMITLSEMLPENEQWHVRMTGRQLEAHLQQQGFTTVRIHVVDTGIIWASRNPKDSPFNPLREDAGRMNVNDKLKVNLVAGSGAQQDGQGWIFSQMTREIVENLADEEDIELTMTAEPDESRPYDIYHYLHSSLAVKHQHMLHRSLVTVHSLDNIAPYRTFASKEDTLKRVPVISSVSRFVIDDLKDNGIPRDKMVYTPQGVMLDLFTPFKGEYRETLIRNFYEKLGGGQKAPKSCVRLGLVGRCYDDGRKGEKFLFEAMDRLGLVDPDTKYELILVGPWWQERCDLAAASLKRDHDNVEVIFTGHVDHEELPMIYQALDVTLVTSKAECGPMSIMESLACGTPVVSTPGGNANEFLTRFHRDDPEVFLGKIVGYGDVPGFVDAIREVTAEEDLRNPQWVSRSMRESEDVIWMQDIHQDDDPYAPYTWEAWAQRFAEIYRRMALSLKGRVFVSDHFTEEAQERFKQVYRQSSKNHLGDVYVKNFELLRPYVSSGSGLISFMNALSGKPAVIIGAGPSLDKDMDDLREAQGDIAIIACDAVLKKLVNEGVIPHIVFCADPSDRQVQNFSDVDGTQFITMLPSVVHPMVFHEARKSDCKVVWYHIADDNHEITKLIPRSVGKKGAIIPGVLTTGMAFMAALWMKAWPVTYLGMDLCWRDLDKGYADGLPESKVEWQRKNKQFGASVQLFPDMHGDTVVTEPCFVSFWQWINRYLREESLIVYNSSDVGLLYGDNIIQMKFDEWLDDVEANDSFDTRARLHQVYDKSRMEFDTIACHQFSDDELQKIWSDVASK